MERQILAFFIITFFAMLIMIWLSVYSWKRRPAKCADTLTFMFLSVTIWMGAILFGLVVRTEPVSYFWSVVRMLGVFAAPVFWFILALQYSGNDKKLRPVIILLLWIIPLISLSLMISNKYHHLFLSGIIYERHGPFLVDSQWLLGPWFPIHVAYSYSLVLIGNFFFFRQAVRLVSGFFGQAVSLFLGAMIPLVVNIIYVFDLIPGVIVNYDPLGFVIAGIIFSACLFRFRFLDIIPIARRYLVDNMQDGLIVIDTQNRIIDINPEAMRNLGFSNTEVLGKDAYSIFPWLPADSQNTIAADNEITLNSLVFDLRKSPLIVGGETVGHLLIMRDITQQKKLESQLRELAQTDPLTGIFNRRHFLKLANDEIARAFRYKHMISVLMIDCDRFKSINDRFGHQVGDQVLVTLSGICKKTVRETDILCRYGGEEFIILSPETPLEDAALLAERLRMAIEDMDFYTNDIHVPITISIGIASMSGESLGFANALDTVIEQTDKALYKAKTSGRNRTHFYIG